MKKLLVILLLLFPVHTTFALPKICTSVMDYKKELFGYVYGDQPGTEKCIEIVAYQGSMTIMTDEADCEWEREKELARKYELNHHQSQIDILNNRMKQIDAKAKAATLMFAAGDRNAHEGYYNYKHKVLLTSSWKEQIRDIRRLCGG